MKRYGIVPSGGVVNDPHKFLIVFEEGYYVEGRWEWELDEDSYAIYRKTR